MKKVRFIVPILASSAALHGQQALSITSTAFKANDPLPVQFVHTHCGGQNQIPPLMWSQLPANTKSIAIIVDDPEGHDEHSNPWIHWIVANLPPTLDKIDNQTNLTELKALQGKNSWGNNQYEGACPPRGNGIHHYQFTVYALDTMLNLDDSATVEKFYDAMQGHVLASGQLVGVYENK